MRLLADRLPTGTPAPQRRLALVRGRADLRQRPAAPGADRRRQPTRRPGWCGGASRRWTGTPPSAAWTRRPCGWSATSGGAGCAPVAEDGDEQPLEAAALVEALVEACPQPASSATGSRRCGPSSGSSAATVRAAGLRLRDRRLPRRPGSRRRERERGRRVHPGLLPGAARPGGRRIAAVRRSPGMKIALLGPIAWRTPPEHYGPWEQVTGLLAEGLVARGLDVTLFATLDSADDRRPGRRLPSAVRRGRHSRRAGLGGDARRPRVRPLGRVRPGAQPPRLAAAGLLRALPGPAGDHDPRVLRPAILPAYRAAASAFVSISDADRVPELDYVATVYHGIDLDPLRLLRRPAATIWSSSAGSIPTRAPPTRSGSPAAPGGGC